MRRAPCHTLGLLILALSATGSATVALAQTPASAPSRYLNWAGRGDVAMPGAAGTPEQPGLAPRRPNRVIPHGGSTPTPAAPALAPDAPRRTLTPANAWMRPPAPAPVAPAASVAMTSATPQPAPVPRAVPDFVPDQGGRGQPAPADLTLATPSPAAAPVAGPVDDPMAPRRDAPIFRMQQDAPVAPPAAAPAAAVVQPAAAAPSESRPVRVAEVRNTGERPPQQGGRYYSVHRQNGRRPDGLEMPEPTYVDALAVTMPETIASQDLAAPEQGPTLIRDNQGRIRPAPAASDGDHQ